MISQSDRDREQYEAREKIQRDVYTALAEKLDEGREQGEAKIQIRRIQSLQRLLRQPTGSPEELQKLPLSELENIAVQHEDQLDAKLRNGS